VSIGDPRLKAGVILEDSTSLSQQGADARGVQLDTLPDRLGRAVFYGVQKEDTGHALVSGARQRRPDQFTQDLRISRGLGMIAHRHGLVKLGQLGQRGALLRALLGVAIALESTCGAHHHRVHPCL
jgi:hypothetical protein